VARTLAIVVGALAVLGVMVVAFARHLDFFSWDAPRPGTILAEQRSPDGTVVATVTVRVALLRPHRRGS
jgi:hypothetical protein